MKSCVRACSGHVCVCSSLLCVLKSLAVWTGRGGPGTKTGWKHPQLSCEWRGEVEGLVVCICVCVQGGNPSLRCCVSAAWATCRQTKSEQPLLSWRWATTTSAQSCQAWGGGGELAIRRSLSDAISYRNMWECIQAEMKGEYTALVVGAIEVASFRPSLCPGYNSIWVAERTRKSLQIFEDSDAVEIICCTMKIFNQLSKMKLYSRIQTKTMPACLIAWTKCKFHQVYIVFFSY